MCESKLYVERQGKRELIMEEAVLVREKDGRVIAVGMLGQRTELEGARIVEVDSDRHIIVVKQP